MTGDSVSEDRRPPSADNVREWAEADAQRRAANKNKNRRGGFHGIPPGGVEVEVPRSTTRKNLNAGGPVRSLTDVRLIGQSPLTPEQAVE